MTREEALEELERLLRHWDLIDDGIYDISEHDEEAVEFAISALRGPTREQVERMFPGCEYCKKHTIKFVGVEMDYNDSPGSPERLNPTRTPKFCPICGAPMTDEAVDMMLERWKEAVDGEQTH